MIRDFSDCRLSGKFYTGAERKTGIRLENEDYIVKFPKNCPTGPTLSHISEYLGCHIFAATGMQTQETWLGTYQGEEVVVMKDFTSATDIFVPFHDVGDSSLDIKREKLSYSYSDIMAQLEANRKLTAVGETVSAFWDMYILDAYIGNFDRHGSNWRFLKNNNQYRLAPVFDNGSCLFPRLASDDQCQKVLQSGDEMRKRIYQFPTSHIQLNGRKSSYYEVISSHQFPACDKALKRIGERLNLETVYELIQGVETMSGKRKEFLICMLQMRYDILIRQPLESPANKCQ